MFFCGAVFRICLKSLKLSSIDRLDNGALQRMYLIRLALQVGISFEMGCSSPDSRPCGSSGQRIAYSEQRSRLPGTGLWWGERHGFSFLDAEKPAGMAGFLFFTL
jgi:hypothetical protein